MSYGYEWHRSLAGPNYSHDREYSVRHKRLGSLGADLGSARRGSLKRGGVDPPEAAGQYNGQMVRAAVTAAAEPHSTSFLQPM